MPVKTGTQTLPWADGEYPFRLGAGELQEIERKCAITGMDGNLVHFGIYEIYERLTSGRWFSRWPGIVIFNGLVGAGMVPKEASALKKRYVDDRPLMENVAISHLLLLSALLAPAGEESKKQEAEVASPSPSANSTEQGPPSGSHRTTSIQ